MRFRTTQRPRGLLTRGVQRRLTLMLLAFGAVLIGIQVFGRPSFWARIFPDPVVEAATESNDAAPSSEEVTHRTTLRPPLSVQLAAPEDQPTSVISDDLLKTITDNVIGVRPSEARAYFVTLSRAETITPTDARLLPPARYALLMDSPDSCRGRAWAVRGTLRRLTLETPTHPSLSDRKLVDAWISLPDSGDGLVHVVALSKDPKLTESLSFDRDPPEVQFSGYFFKREAYLVADQSKQLTIAPLMLAGEIQRVPTPVATEARSDQLTPWLGWLALATCGGIIVIVWMFAVSDANHRGQRTHELTRLPSSVSFKDVDTVNPDDAIRKMQAAAERASEHTFREPRL